MAGRTAHALTPASPPILGPVLVTGGCGFLGYHLVAHLLADPERGSGHVYVLDRDVANSENRHAGNVTYIEGSVTDAALVASVLQETRPRVIFHAASPPASLPPSRWSDFEATNVAGTAILLAAAAASETVEAFVYTSSADVYADPPHHDVAETHPLVPDWDSNDRRRGVGVTEYMRTKAAGQRLVLAANTPALRTCALLPAHMYGERSSQGLREILDLCDDGGDGKGWWPRPPLVQLGAGTNLMDVASAANVAQAHILAAKALVDPGRARGAVAGQSFNVTDGRPVAFWHEHVRAVWKEARGGREAGLGNVIVVPGWVYVAIAWVVRTLFWALMLGIVLPPVAFSEQAILYALGEHTYSVDKLRNRLGFEPVQDHDEVMKQAVRWELDRRQQCLEEARKVV